MAILRVVLKPPTIINEELEYKIEHDVPEWHNHLIYLLAYLRIVSVSVDCSGSTVTVHVTGGHLPYQYSYNSGTTFTSPTKDPYWTFSIDSGATYNIFVKDSDYDFYSWENISCSQITVNFEPVYLSLTSTGYITDETITQHTTSFSVTKNKLDTYSLSATTTNSTTFVGWSYDKPNLYSYVNCILLTGATEYTHTFVNNTTVYAIYVKNYDTVSFDVCYFPTLSGYSANQTDRDFYCVNCGLSGTTIPIYINGTDYATYGRDDSVWYSDSGCTILADTGYYKFPADENPSLYNIINGVVISVENCEGIKKKIC